VAFAETPRMSTYLVRGWWETSSAAREGGWVAVRVCATPDKVKLTRVCAGRGEADAARLRQVFGINIRWRSWIWWRSRLRGRRNGDFGCITFRETDLLVAKKDGALAAKRRLRRWWRTRWRTSVRRPGDASVVDNLC